MWLPLLVVGSVVAMAVYLYPLIRMDYVSQREVERLEVQLTSLQDRNEDLREQVDRLKTPEGVEEAARENLGYVKPGENAYVVVEAGGSGEETGVLIPVTETVLLDEPVPWWRRWLDRIFGVGS